MIITILSDSPTICTGYSDQSKKLAKYLTEQGHEVHFLANGYVGQTLTHIKLEDGTEFNYKIYGRIGHQYFADLLPTHLKKTKSDILLIILDTFMLHGDPKNPQNGWFLHCDHSPAKAVFWYPSDGGAGMPIGCDLILKKCDSVVAYSKFAQKQVKDYYGLTTPYIPLGTEPNRFYKLPVEQREQLRAKWGLTGKFVVGVVARNQPRKFLDRTIKAFKRVADRVPNAILLLHTDPSDMAAPFNLANLARRYNLENRIRFTGMSAVNAFSWNQMNEVYNLFDCFFLTTSGEGWGIPLVEAMAVEVPIVATNYTTIQEIVVNHKAGLGVKLVGTKNEDFFGHPAQQYDIDVDTGTITGSWEVERGLMDTNDAAEKIIKLANDPELCRKFGENGRKTVLEKYDQKIVNKKFEELFKSLL